MNSSASFILVSLSSLMFIIVVFMNFIGRWSADPFTVFNVGVMTNQRLKKS
ncbi:hypothetical protein [Alkalicoccobacillus murimartini]|uniref:Uncharacterized protein n=1 Tax=Alkalicoccobacillus murimartini TaxID=171685 RepID=A0ABT9YLM2_9BACI|nr:hypothetical protein [Alkalicoccobacillus murimartini]MDQ0208777.1 hypothetical protein [Alkalicoccobacillus murimartini]